MLHYIFLIGHCCLNAACSRSESVEKLADKRQEKRSPRLKSNNDAKHRYRNQHYIGADDDDENDDGDDNKDRDVLSSWRRQSAVWLVHCLRFPPTGRDKSVRLSKPRESVTC